jgi:Dullard-like phosphatase family protein
MLGKVGKIMLKHEISDDKRHQGNTSYMTKEIGNVFFAVIAFAISLATTFTIYSITITTTFLLSFLKSLINIITCCKSIPSPPSRTGTFSPSPNKPIPTRYHARHERKISISHFISKSMCEKTVLPRSFKCTLFLSLFRVLIHFTIDQPHDQFNFVVHPVIKGKRRACYVVKRPGLDEFLRAAKNASLEVVIYTSGCSEYAGPIIDALDPTRKLITYRLFQNACTKRKNGLLMKNLILTGRQLDRCVIIDDNPKLHVKQWANAIAVRPFLGDHADTDLIDLMKLFEVERKFNDLWHLIQLKRLGIISLSGKDTEEFVMEAYKISLLQSLNLNPSVTNFAYAQLCLNFKYLPPPLEQSLKLIASVKNLTLNHPSYYLVKITLKDSKLPENTIQILQRLPNLIALSLILHDSYDGKDLKFPRRTFLKLEVLSLEDQDNLSSVTFEEHSMPELKELSVTSSNFDFIVAGIGNLLKLKKINVCCGEEENGVQDTIQ